jgi:two-component system NarL family sensor kinase
MEEGYACSISTALEQRHPDMSRRPVNGPAILYWMLIGLVLFSYAAPLYIGITQAFPIHDTPALWLLNALALIVLFLTITPVWRWVQPRVHDIVYGVDAPQIDVIGQLSDALAYTSLDAVHLIALAETIIQIVHLPYVQIEMVNGAMVAAGKPHQAGVRTRIELIYRDALVGWLEVMSRLPGEPLSAGDYRLLHSLARQVSITLHVAQLSDALQASREQLVLAREEERRRIRRDLHDGLGPTLASLRLQLSALRRIIGENHAAEQLIDELRTDVRTATAEIRRLVYDLRPPMLDEFGLLGALHNLELAGGGLERTIDAPATLPSLPAALEVALYRIATEALHNITRHAHATRCSIHLALHDDTVTLAVTDNGCGLPAHYLPGVGHRSMHERASELGGTVTIFPGPSGGTCVTATFRLKAEYHD